VLFLFVVRDYKTVALPRRTTRAKHRLSARAVTAELFRPRTALVTCIGAGLNLLVVSTTWAWLPSYLNRYHGLAPDQAGLKTGLVVLVGGIGAFLWSVIADRLSSRLPRRDSSSRRRRR
jgi:cyanate permease